MFLAALPAIDMLPPDQRRALSAVQAWDQRLTTPAMLLVWGLGLTLALSQGWFAAPWLQAKLVFVLALSALHGVQSGALRRLAGGAGRTRQQIVPTLVITISVASIAMLAVVKPF